MLWKMLGLSLLEREYVYRKICSVKFRRRCFCCLHILDLVNLHHQISSITLKILMEHYFNLPGKLHVVLSWKSDACIKKSEINLMNYCGGREVAAETHTDSSITVGDT